MKFEEELKRLRAKRNQSQEKVARALKISARTYTRWENGKARPTAINLLRVADYYKVEPSHLLSLLSDDSKPQVS